MNEQIRLREWSRLKFYDPELFIRKLNAVEREVANAALPDCEKALRTNRLKPLREARQAALFALGLRVFNGNPNIEFAAHESSDYDAIFRWHEDSICYAPIQLKEVVPDRWNPDACVNAVLQKLLRLQSSADLVVGIHYTRANKKGKLEIEVPNGLDLAGLFVFGSASEDRSRWMITGNLMTDDVGPIYYDVPTN